MSSFSLEDYQIVLEDLGDEIRRYGQSRQAFDLATQALETLSGAGRELRDAQAAIEKQLDDVIKSVKQSVEQNATFTDHTQDSLVAILKASTSIESQLSAHASRISEHERRVELISQKLDEESKKLESWQIAKDDELKTLLDNNARLESRIAAEGQRNIITGYTSIGMVLIAIVLIAVGILV